MLKKIYEQGIHHMNQGAFPKAISLFDQILQQEPQNKDALLMRGLCYYEQENPNWDFAIRDFKAVVKLDPQADFYCLIASCYQMRPDRNFKHLELALQNYNQALKIDPKSPDALFGRAQVYLSIGYPHFEQAIIDYTNALKYDPQNIWAVFGRGVVYKNKPDPDYKKALADLNTFIQVRPDVADGYYERGNTYFQMGFDYHKQVIADYKQALKLEPDHPQARQMENRLRTFKMINKEKLFD